MIIFYRKIFACVKKACNMLGGDAEKGEVSLVAQSGRGYGNSGVILIVT